tara:strand:- start:1436 stop:1546 length:111 start_codon:yes stop_codon:yes gene_type:complete
MPVASNCDLTPAQALIQISADRAAAPGPFLLQVEST